MCDATTDSELSIRQLELTPNTSENSFRLNSSNTMQKYSKESIDSGCQNETQNGETIQTNENAWQHCDLKIVDITKHIRNTRKMDTLDLMVNCRKSSSSTFSDASSCGTNRSTSTEQRKRSDSPKYHSTIKSRLRKDATVLRSKSFQEQDIRKSSKFYISQQMPQNDFRDDYKLNKTISHHTIEITIEDTDAKDEPINHRVKLRPSKELKHTECSSLNSSDFHYKQRHRIRSGHILGRIFRRMRKFSMAWRKSKNKSRTRGEFPFFFLLSFGFLS